MDAVAVVRTPSPPVLYFILESHVPIIKKNTYMYIPCLHIVVIVAVVVVVVLAVVGIVAKLFLDMVLFCDY